MTVSRVVELPGVRQATADARAAMDLLRGERILRTKGPEVRALALSESARAAAQLGGIELPVSVALLQASIESASAIAAAPMQSLARFHAIVLADRPAGERGRPRELADAERERLFALNGLLGAQASVPALIVAALVMAEILDIAPFEEANEIVARATFRSVLIGRGFDPEALALPEAGMLALGATSLAPALAAYRTGTPEGVAAWLRHLASAVQFGARRGIEICAEVGSTPSN